MIESEVEQGIRSPGIQQEVPGREMSPARRWLQGEGGRPLSLSCHRSGPAGVTSAGCVRLESSDSLNTKPCLSILRKVGERSV